MDILLVTTICSSLLKLQNPLPKCTEMKITVLMHSNQLDFPTSKFSLSSTLIQDLEAYWGFPDLLDWTAFPQQQDTDC